MVSRLDVFSLSDIFLQYNQVLIMKPKKLKATFKTKWYIHVRQMLLGLINVVATF